MTNANPNVESWTQTQVCRWLQGLGNAYTMYTTAFQYHGIDGDMLLCIGSPDDFAMLGVMVDLHRTRIQQGVRELQNHMVQFREQQLESVAAAADSAAAAAADSAAAAAAATTTSEQKTPDPVNLSEDLLSRYPGDDEYNDSVTNLFARSVPQLSTEAREKIRSLVNNDTGE